MNADYNALLNIFFYIDLHHIQFDLFKHIVLSINVRSGCTYKTRMYKVYNQRSFGYLIYRRPCQKKIGSLLMCTGYKTHWLILSANTSSNA